MKVHSNFAGRPNIVFLRSHAQLLLLVAFISKPVPCRATVDSTANLDASTATALCRDNS